MLLIDEQMNMSLTKGDTAELNIAVRDASGNPYDYSSDQTMKFCVKEDYADAPVIEISIPLNTGVLSIAAANTSSLDAGDYFYDIHLVTVGGDVCTFIANKRFTILPEAHLGS